MPFDCSIAGATCVTRDVSQAQCTQSKDGVCAWSKANGVTPLQQPIGRGTCNHARTLIHASLRTNMVALFSGKMCAWRWSSPWRVTGLLVCLAHRWIHSTEKLKITVCSTWREQVNSCRAVASPIVYHTFPIVSAQTPNGARHGAQKTCTIQFDRGKTCQNGLTALASQLIACARTHVPTCT